MRRLEQTSKTAFDTSVYETVLRTPAVISYSRRRKSLAGWGFHRCLSGGFPHDILKIDAARITKRDIEMFHDESGNFTLGSTGQS